MADIFISCANNDLNEVQQIKYEIDDYLGTNCSINNNSSRSGQLPASVQEAIDRAGVFVFILSGSSLNDQKTIDEITYAQFRGKRIVVISLEGTAMPDDFIDRFGYLIYVCSNFGYLCSNFKKTIEVYLQTYIIVYKHSYQITI